ncbi:hypothetical protein CS387_02905 [Porphyromonas gingivalis]|nr:hypothetical protein CS387_02905 [Porphyromonas gingivalis]
MHRLSSHPDKELRRRSTTKLIAFFIDDRLRRHITKAKEAVPIESGGSLFRISIFCVSDYSGREQRL